MIYWKPFEFQGQIYDLSHLHPQTLDYAHKTKNTGQLYNCTIQVVYGLHCFTRGIKEGENADKALHYRDLRECRIFDFTRYALSRQLPDIIAKLTTGYCYHTGKGNFFTFKLINQDGEIQHYEIYFKPYRSSKRILTLYIESAYVRDNAHAASRPKRKKIDFHVVVLNTLTRKPIRVPK